MKRNLLIKILLLGPFLSLFCLSSCATKQVVGEGKEIKAPPKEVVKVEKQLIQFKATVWDSVELIGEADHQRVIIDVERFLNRVEKKVSGLPNGSASLA